jgi:hypothetical protein
MGVTLIGTVHLDPGGYARLLDLLAAEEPATVTVEVSPYGLRCRRTHLAKYRHLLDAFRRPDGRLPNGLEAVAAQVEIPFEYRAAAAYAEIYDARVVRVGDSQESRRLLDLLERELMATDNLLALALREERPLEEVVAREWERARQGFEREPVLGSEAARRLVRRNGRMARKIRPLSARGPLVHVGGWEHLHGLRELLADLRPRVMLLNPSSADRG